MVPGMTGTAVSSEQNRRYFPRVKLRTHASLKDASGREWPVHLLDLSFNGALAALIHKHNLKVGESVVLHIESDQKNGPTIRCRGSCHISKITSWESNAEPRVMIMTQLRELLKRSQRRLSGLDERSYG